jgi:hypothetical protein
VGKTTRGLFLLKIITGALGGDGGLSKRITITNV